MCFFFGVIITPKKTNVVFLFPFQLLRHVYVALRLQISDEAGALPDLRSDENVRRSVGAMGRKGALRKEWTEKPLFVFVLVKLFGFYWCFFVFLDFRGFIGGVLIFVFAFCFVFVLVSLWLIISCLAKSILDCCSVLFWLRLFTTNCGSAIKLIICLVGRTHVRATIKGSRKYDLKQKSNVES